MAVKIGRRAKEIEVTPEAEARRATLEAASGQLFRLEMLRAIPSAGFEHGFDSSMSEGADRVCEGLEALLAGLLGDGVTPEEVVAGFARTMKGVAAGMAGGEPYPLPETLTRTNEIYLLLRDMRAHPAGCLYLLAEAMLMLVIIMAAQEEADRLARARKDRRGRAGK